MNFVWLAAGNGSRMGMPKVLMDFAGEKWLTVQLRALSTVPIIDRVLIVTDADRQAEVRELAGDAENVSVLVNPDPSRGPLSSLQVALEHDGGPCFVSPIDVPVAQRSVFDALLAAVQAGPHAAVPVLGERGGHPVLLDASFIGLMRRADPQRDRLDHLLHGGAAHVARVIVSDASVLQNLNTPEDLSKLRIAGHGLTNTPK
jgi:CTP:molybdopterin cytidylyltransferase MocA